MTKKHTATSDGVYEQLKEKIDFLNNKSKNSLENSVGISDVIFCWCVFGENMNELRRFYHEYGFPKNDGVVLSKLWKLDSLASSCRFALSNLEKNISIDDSDFLELGRDFEKTGKVNTHEKYKVIMMNCRV